MVDAFPGLEGMVEPRYCLPFDELDIEIIEPRHFKKLGKLLFIHGDLDRGFGSIHHAKKAVELYNKNVVYGDKHTLQVFTKISPYGINETHSGYAIPCLADTNPKWARNKPNAWINGFGLFFVTEQRFSVIPIVAINNSFIGPDGIVYEP